MEAPSCPLYLHLGSKKRVPSNPLKGRIARDNGIHSNRPYAFSYLDDIIIVTETFEEHLIMLERVLARIKKAGLTINREKSVFGISEVKYLGILVNQDRLRPDTDKIAPVIQHPEPKNLKQLRCFLGMVS